MRGRGPAFGWVQGGGNIPPAGDPWGPGGILNLSKYNPLQAQKAHPNKILWNPGYIRKKILTLPYPPPTPHCFPTLDLTESRFLSPLSLLSHSSRHSPVSPLPSGRPLPDALPSSALPFGRPLPGALPSSALPFGRPLPGALPSPPLLSPPGAGAAAMVQRRRWGGAEAAM